MELIVQLQYSDKKQMLRFQHASALILLLFCCWLATLKEILSVCPHTSLRLVFVACCSVYCESLASAEIEESIKTAKCGGCQPDTRTATVKAATVSHRRPGHTHPYQSKL